MSDDDTILPQMQLTHAEKQKQAFFLKSRGINTDKPFNFIPWSEKMRMHPNDMARSALFTAKPDKAERVFFKGERIPSTDPTIKITYRGEELRTKSDEKIWLQLLHYAREKSLGELVLVSIHKLCIDLGWPPNKDHYSIARQSLERLNSAHIKITVESKVMKGKTVYFRMIDLKQSDETFVNDASKFGFSIEPLFIMLVAGNTTSYLEWAHFKKLKPTEARLYAIIRSHKEPRPLELMRFYEVCGSRNANKSSWIQEVRRALKKLLDLNLIKDGYVHGDLIYIKR